MRLVLLLPLLAACVGSVDEVGSIGELGHLGFEVQSEWYMDESDLTAVSIVTGHPQSVGVHVTERGGDLAKDHADELDYAMDPDEGVTIEQSGPMDDDVDDPPPPSLLLTVTEPGEYTLLARLDDEVFDHIQLRFDAPAALELALFTRAPYGEEFAPLVGAGPSQVREGTQLAWLPIPVDAAGARLVGELETTMTADPADLIVPADNVYNVNEDEVGDYAAASLYFIEPGDVTVSVGDTFNPAVGTHAFTVVAE